MWVVVSLPRMSKRIENIQSEGWKKLLLWMVLNLELVSLWGNENMRRQVPCRTHRQEILCRQRKHFHKMNENGQYNSTHKLGII